jgi:hypothetical protein
MPVRPRRAYRTLIRGQRQTSTKFVENSVVLEIGDVVGSSHPKPSPIHSIALSWESPFQTTIAGEVDLSDSKNAFVRLRYELDGLPLDQCVSLTRSEQPTRWWFVCPLSNIRVAKLYLPQGTRRFGSRTAHGLIYKCQVPSNQYMQLSQHAFRLFRRSRRRRQD